MTENAFKNNQALENLNDNFPEIMNDRGSIASNLLSLLSKNIKPEITGQFKLVKDRNSNRVKDLLIQNTISTTLFNNLVTFRDTGKKFQLKGDP